MTSKAYALAPVSGGGKPPDAGTILSTSFAEFGDNLAPYAILGAIQMAVLFPLVFIAIFVGYFVMVLTTAVVYVVGMGVSVGLASLLPEDLAGPVAAIGMLITLIVSLLATIASMFAVVLLITLPVAPLHAAFVRAIAAHQRGEGPPEPAKAFATITQDLVPVVTVAVIMGGASLVGLLFFGVGALVPAFLFAFAPSLVALHRMGPIDALRASARHALADPTWHGIWTALNWGLGLAASNIPVLGPAFMMAFQVRGHRELFGDGPEPVLGVADPRTAG